MLLRNKIALLSFLVMLSLTQSAHTKPVAEGIKDVSQNVFQRLSKIHFQTLLPIKRKNSLKLSKLPQKLLA
ncbi:MAG: hypothetical protein IPJ69_09270 [Deltaproteobacteria bacterium]|nr:MAG: hypothetical protein IPJ69_09270 [Deltaproteobacteria bacterium]